MEISLLQCTFIGLWTGFCITGMLTGTYLTRCLVMSFGVGVILGDVETGLLMGAAGELAFLGFGVSSGGSVPPNPVGPGIIGAIIAITMKGKGVDTGAALAYSIPFAILIQFMITGIYTLTAGAAPKAQKAVEEGRYGRFHLLANSTLLLFVLAGFFIGFLAAFQADTLGAVISFLPDRLTSALGIAGKMLPAVGFAVILSVMVTLEIGPFVLLGYVLSAFLNLSVIGIALSAAAIAWLKCQGTAWKSGVKACGSPGASCRTGEILTQRELRRLSRRTALRAYFLQNSFNYGNYEGLGYAQIMFPALKRLCKTEKELQRETVDSMAFCNCNPNFLPILTSIHLVALNHGVSGRETADIRLALMGPLAGIGDSLVQFCLAPVLSTLGAAMAKEGLTAGPVVFLLGMNILLLGLKLAAEALGFRTGTSLMEKMKGSLEEVSRGARMVGSAVIAGLAVTCVDMQANVEIVRETETVFQLQNFLDTFLPGILPLAYTGLLFYLVKKRKWSMYRLAAITLAVGVGFGLTGILK